MTLEKICSSRDSSSGSQSWIICELTSCKHIFTWAAKTSSSFYNSFHFLFSRQVVSVQSQNTIQNLEVWTTRRCATEEADTPAQNGGQAAALLWFRGILQALSPPGQRFLFLLLDLGGGAPPRHLACDKNWRRKKRQLAMKLLEVWTPDSIYNLSHYVYWLCEVQMHWTVDAELKHMTLFLWQKERCSYCSKNTSLQAFANETANDAHPCEFSVTSTIWSTTTLL